MKPIPLAECNNKLDLVCKHMEEINDIGGALFGNGNWLPTPRYDTKQTLVLFPNGYGVSFIKGGISYGLEAAIVKYDGTNDLWDLCYDTPITDDVISYMDEDDIVTLCKGVALLERGE